MLCFKVNKCLHPHDAHTSHAPGLQGGAAPEDGPSTPQAFTPSKKAASLARASELKQLLLASGVTPTMPNRDQLVINLECIDTPLDDTAPRVSPFSQQPVELANTDTEVQPFATSSNTAGQSTPALQQSSLTRSSAIRGFVRVQSLSIRQREAPSEQLPQQAPLSPGLLPTTPGPQSPMPRLPTLPGTMEVDEDLHTQQQSEDLQGMASEAVTSTDSTAMSNSQNSRSLQWTPSRRVLAQLVVREEHLSRTDKALQNLSHDQRLAQRLERLGLEMIIMAGDGNCQFRTLANELFGSQDFHAHVRAKVIDHIRTNKDSFECFLGEDFDKYVASMARHGTWGDELTLRAACDAYGVTVNVVTSDPQNWFITYEPETSLSDAVELFCTYLAPIHYNAIRRKPSLRQMSKQLGSSLKRFGLTRSGHMSLSRGTSSDPTSPVSSLSSSRDIN